MDDFEKKVIDAAQKDSIAVLDIVKKKIEETLFSLPDEYHQMNIELPKIPNSSEKSATDKINEDVETLANQLMEQFYRDLETIGNEGHSSIKTEYEVITNNSDWFTLKITVLYIAGSGSMEYRFYHVDRNTGEFIK